MAICVENDEGEQMLPEGGILLEIVDQGENGEPILAIPDMDPPVSPPLQEHCSENTKVPDEMEEVTSDSSENIVVDDEDTASEAPVKVAGPVTLAPCSDVNEMVITKPKEEIKDRNPSRRKKKKKCKKVCQVEPVEGRVLRSTSMRKTVQETLRKPSMIIQETKKNTVPMVPDASIATYSSLINKKINSGHAEIHTEIISTATLSPEMCVKEAASVSSIQDTVILNASPERHGPGCTPTAANSIQLNEMPKELVPILDKLEVVSVAKSGVLPVAQAATVATESLASAPIPVTIALIHPPCEALPPVAPTVPEPKPKSLSLEEYWRLRQQKKPAPFEKQENHSTKWPSLPELPKELPPIPSLPDPSPRDPRRTHPLTAKKEVDEVKTAWQPRGPGAPPTPEALLVPPAYMVVSSTKVSSATPILKLQQASAPQTVPTPKSVSKNLKHSAAAGSMKVLLTDIHTTIHPSMPCASQSSGSLSSKPATQVMLAVDSKPTHTLSGEKTAVVQCPPLQPVELSTVCPKTTTDKIKPTTPNASAQIVSNVPPKTTTIAQKMPEVNAPSSVNYPRTCNNGKPSKPTTVGTQSCSSPDLKADPVMLGAKGMPTTTSKSHTQEFIKSFTSEIGE